MRVIWQKVLRKEGGIDMKTIEERAREYAGVHKATEFNYFGVGQVYGYERIYNAEITAYERGAKEQKAIDIEKACEWLDTYLMEIGYPDDWMRDSPNMESGKERFRKAMEE